MAVMLSGAELKAMVESLSKAIESMTLKELDEAWGRRSDENGLMIAHDLKGEITYHPAMGERRAKLRRTLERAQKQARKAKTARLRSSATW